MNIAGEGAEPSPQSIVALKGVSPRAEAALSAFVICVPAEFFTVPGAANSPTVRFTERPGATFWFTPANAVCQLAFGPSKKFTAEMASLSPIAAMRCLNWFTFRLACGVQATSA